MSNPKTQVEIVSSVKHCISLKRYRALFKAKTGNGQQETFQFGFSKIMSFRCLFLQKVLFLLEKHKGGEYLQEVGTFSGIFDL